MNSEQVLQPGKKPIPTETVFGDPEALNKAASNVAVYPYCTQEDMHCPWIESCSDPNWQCPLHAERNISREATNGKV